MPVSVAQRGDLFRIIESDGKLAKNKAGSVVDGGGHKTRSAAEAQSRAVNANKAKAKMEQGRLKNRQNRRRRNMRMRR